VGDRADVVRWEWRGDGAVRDVRAAGAGVVVAGDDGVSALDGVTGTERWSFARAGARLTEMIVSPDGRSVVIVHTGTSSRVAVAVLDAMTGERRWETTLDRPPVPLVTNAVVALGTRVEEPDDGALVPLPPGCGEEAAAAVTDTTVLRLCRRDPFFDVQTGDAAPVPLNLRHGDPFAALSLLRDAFIVPAPGAVVVGVPTNSRAHLTGLG
jgi:outer membrane protein assembly factor BamB